MSRGRRTWCETRIRRCIASGQRRHQGELLRFVVDPAGHLIPDLGRSLAGRGLWIECSRPVLQGAIKGNLFARAARRDVVVATDLPARVEQGLVGRLLATLAGQRYRDGAGGSVPDGKTFLFPPRGVEGAGETIATAVTVYRCLEQDELDVISHGSGQFGIVVPEGGIAGRIRLEAERLLRFRVPDSEARPVAGPH